MDVKKVALLIGALVIAVITAVMAKNMFAGAGAQQAAAAPVPTGPKILVAKKALPVGTIIDANQLRLSAVAEGADRRALIIWKASRARPQGLFGTVVRYPITAGQPITRGSLVGPEDRGFLAAALGPGMRAITVPVNATTGVAGFVFPGDHVDIVLTQTVEGGGDGPPLKVSETIVRNVRVLATDQRITDKDEEGKVEVKTFTNVTLEVTPRIAEKIAVSQSIGTLSLSLRSIADNAAELERPSPRATSRSRPAPTRQEKKILFAVANRPIAQQSDLHHRWRRVALPAPHRPGRPPEKGSASQAAPLLPRGPTVKVARGNEVAVVPVGAR